MKERWKQIIGFDSYQVSDLGRVRSIRTNAIKKIHTNKSNGYNYVQLWKDNNHTLFKVARLVGFAFIRNPKGKPTINHKDGIKTNDVCSNLEWATYSENIKHSYDSLGRMPSRAMLGKFGFAHNRSKSILYKGKLFGSISEAARILNMDRSKIQRHLKQSKEFSYE
jgi:hypothetical protein